MILIIPDIHEKTSHLRKLDEQFGTDTPRIYLGDWFDAYDSTPASRQATLDYLATEFQRQDRTFLWGNHDYQYHDSRGRCSGYSKDMAERIKKTLPEKWYEKFTIVTRLPHLLISHAGFNKLPEDWTSAESMLTSIGYSRGGYSPEGGGPLWLDWTKEFIGIPDVMQIVGHSTGHHPRLYRNRAINIDTGLRHIAIVGKDGEIEVQELHL